VTDAQAFARLDSLIDRLKVCAVALVVAFVLAYFPIPFVLPESIAQRFMMMIFEPAESHLLHTMHREGFRAYVYVSLMLAAVFALPVITWQALDALTPHDVRSRTRYVLTTVVRAHAGFAIGAVVWTIFLMPIVIFLWQRSSFGTDVPWSLAGYIGKMMMLMVTLGLIFELPALVVGVVRLGVTDSARQIMRSTYVWPILLVYGAVIASTIDILTMLVVASLAYLFFEVGVQLSRLGREELRKLS
jgi:sec-independent protein translocase protein TatC